MFYVHTRYGQRSSMTVLTPCQCPCPCWLFRCQNAGSDNRSRLDKIINQSCAIHPTTRDDQPPTYTDNAGSSLGPKSRKYVPRKTRLVLYDGDDGHRPVGKDHHTQGQYPFGVKDVYMIYETRTSKKQRKRALREVCTIEAALPQVDSRSEIPITFDHRYTPMGIGNKGVAALVLGPSFMGFAYLGSLMKFLTKMCYMLETRYYTRKRLFISCLYFFIWKSVHLAQMALSRWIENKRSNHCLLPPTFSRTHGPSFSSPLP